MPRYTHFPHPLTLSGHDKVSDRDGLPRPLAEIAKRENISTRKFKKALDRFGGDVLTLWRADKPFDPPAPPTPDRCCVLVEPEYVHGSKAPVMYPKKNQALRAKPREPSALFTMPKADDIFHLERIPQVYFWLPEFIALHPAVTRHPSRAQAKLFMRGQGQLIATVLGVPPDRPEFHDIATRSRRQRYEGRTNKLRAEFEKYLNALQRAPHDAPIRKGIPADWIDEIDTIREALFQFIPADDPVFADVMYTPAGLAARLERRGHWSYFIGARLGRVDNTLPMNGNNVRWVQKRNRL